MKKIGIFYGSTTGTTESIARMIGEKLSIGNDNIHDAAKLTKGLAEKYDFLILGTSTWGDGELQDDWYDAVKTLTEMNLSGKTIALFGCGDSESYSDTFCDGIGILYKDLKATGCKFCGYFPIDGYTFDNSQAVENGYFIGLPLDEMNEDNMTKERIEKWIDILKKECIDK